MFAKLLNKTKRPSDGAADLAKHYDVEKELGKGKFGVARLAKDKKTGELVAIKFLERGQKIDQNVEREVILHHSLDHPNIIAFKKAYLTPQHLAIVMEYAAGGELYNQIAKKGRLAEPEARFYFAQLVSGLTFLHSMGTCHRDLKLENILLDADMNLKLADFGYAKSSVYHSTPHTTVGTPTYVAPEVLQHGEAGYDGYQADVWSIGVMLYVMLVGKYPFEDPQNPANLRGMFMRIMKGQYSFPRDLPLSAEVQDLIGRCLVLDPMKRAKIDEIQAHPWVAREVPHQQSKEKPSSAKHAAVQQTQSQLQDLLLAAKEVPG